MTEETLFELMLKSPEAERAALLDRECAGQPELRRRMEALLRADAAASPLSKKHLAMDATSGDVPTQSYESTDPVVGRVIAGKYKLLQQIGEGGMGSVWMADQTEPVKRRVAVKLIRTDRGSSRTILARFEAERQAIALMDHPHIAKLLDAGTTEDNIPYFIMELVKGVPLTEFCDARKLNIPERLNLFMQICSAVQHAHQKGIIHRDLKPSNILVELHDDKPVPKVIDFGLAKATSGMQLTENTLFTGFGAVAGTPSYMSPEQASFNAEDIDTRADIYALGVILYELLTGTTPITKETLKKAALDEMMKLIREQEAPTPSSRLSSSEMKPNVAANRHTEPQKLGRYIKGELDWIVMKALSKERDRRYETANGFAKDIERFLNHEAVQAGPVSAGYRLKKFVQRNRGMVLAGSLIFLALLGGLVMLWGGVTAARYGLQRAKEAEKAAREDQLEAVKQKDIAEAEKRKAQEAEEKTMASYRAGTDDAIERLIGSKPELGPEERAYLMKTLERWQEFAKREGNDERSQVIRAEGHFRMARLWQKLGERAASRTEYENARDLYKKLAASYPAMLVYQQNQATAHNNLGILLVDLGQRDAARKEYETARDVQMKLVAAFPAVPEYQHGLANAHNNLGILLKDLGQRDAARTEFETARDLQKKLVTASPDMPEYQQELARNHNNLGLLLNDLGQRDAARTEYETARNLQKKLAAAFPAMRLYQQELANTLNNLGALLAGLDQRDAARTEYETARDIQTKLAAAFPAMPQYQLSLADTHNNLGLLLADLGQRDAARKEYETARDIRKKLVAAFPAIPEYQQELARTHNNLGLLLADLGQWDAARSEYETASSIQKKLVAAFPAMSEIQVDLGGSYQNSGSLLQREGKLAESLPWFDLAIRTLAPVHEKEPRDVTAKEFLRNSHWGRAFAHVQLKKHGQAVKDWDRAIELSPPAEQPGLCARRVNSRMQAGQVAEAVAEVAVLTAPGANATGLAKWNAAQWYDFACVYAVASGKIAGKKQPNADRAMELLHHAVKAGYKDAAHMKKDTDLDPLRDRDDFKKLLEELSQQNEKVKAKPQ